MKKKWMPQSADLMTAMEPMMIVVLGMIVGGIVISMYMPIFTLVGQLRKSRMAETGPSWIAANGFCG